MNLKTVLTLILTFITISIFSQTSVSGIVSGTWNLAGSPYNVEDDLTIANGTTLTIEPGVVVSFTEKYKFIVNGSITAAGSSDEHIVFQTSDATDYWYGFEFINVATSNDSSIFEYCEFRESFAENADDNNKNGGAIFINQSNKIRVSNSLFENNIANNFGGAIYGNNTDVKIINNTISNNSADWYGGGIYFKGVSTEPAFIDNNIINSNSCTNLGSGGGIYTSGTNAIISNNKISENSAEYAGGGVLLAGSDGIVFENNEVFENFTFYDKGGKKANSKTPNNKILEPFNGVENPLEKTGKPTVNTNQTSPNFDSEIKEPKGFGSGGGIEIDGGNGYVQNNYVHHNSSTYAGGGIHLSGNNMKVNSNLITHNFAETHGGGMFITSFNGTSANNTIMYNRCDGYCDGIYFNNSNPDIYNFLVRYNYGTGSYANIWLQNSQPNFYNSSITYTPYAFDGDDHTGIYENINSFTPCFNYTGGTIGGISGLEPYSGLVNSGYSDITNLNLPETDIFGNPRVFEGTVDIGCIESQENFIETRIGGEQTGTLSSGKYYVTEDITVPAGQTLTIEAGAKLYFYGNYSINNYGTIEAIGTSNNPILFTTADTTGFDMMQVYYYGGWEHIIVNENSNATFEYVNFSYSKVNNRLEPYYTGNNDNDFGGFIFARKSTPSIKNCSFTNTMSFTFGGAIASINTEEEGALIENCIFMNLITATYQHTTVIGGEGGAIFAFNSSPEIVNNLMQFNITTVSGIGGGYPKGGAILLTNSHSKIINNTITENFSYNGGGVLIREIDEITLKNDIDIYNNIVWENSLIVPTGLGEQFFVMNNTSDIEFFNNDIDGGQNEMHLPDGFNGIYTNNIDQDPQFTGLFSIDDESPCKDSGFEDMSGFNIPELDLIGNTRIVNEIIDIGSQENQLAFYSVTFIVSDNLEPEITLAGYGTQTAIGGTTTFTEIPATPEPGIAFEAELAGYQNYNGNVVIDENETVEISLVVSNIENILDNQINVFPNPSNGIFIITNISNDDNYHIKISDISGKIVFSQKMVSSQIDLSEQKKGVYFLKIESKKHSFTKKIIIH